MKVGIYGRVFLKSGGGIVRYSFEVVEALLKYCPENVYVFYFKRGEVPKLNFKGKYEIREIDLPYFLWRTSLFTRILDDDGIDVYHSTDYRVPLVPKSMRNVSIVATFHGLHSEFFRWPIKETIYSVLNYRMGAIFSDRIISVSKALKKEINELYGKPLNMIDVTYVGVSEDLKPLKPSEMESYRKRIMKKYKIPGDGYIIYVGAGLAENKNTITAFRSWKILKEEYKLRIPLVLTRVDTNKIKDILEDLDLEDGRDIIGLKWVGDGDLRILYACSEFSIYPSIYEGLGWPILEAMACGTPVITSDISAMPEAADGAGILVKAPKNPEEWAEKIVMLHKDKGLMGKLRKSSLEWAKRFTWKRIAKETEDSYKRAVMMRKRQG